MYDPFESSAFGEVFIQSFSNSSVSYWIGIRKLFKKRCLSAAGNSYKSAVQIYDGALQIGLYFR